MNEQSANSTLLLPRSRRKLELKGLARKLQAELGRLDRLVIAGGPQAGKTTLADSIFRDWLTIHRSDDLKGYMWSEASLVASTWLDEPGPWICEGVAMPRALRKWLARNPGDSKPADKILWLGEPVAPRSRGQHAMALGCDTVFRKILPELEQRGVEILEF